MNGLKRYFTTFVIAIAGFMLYGQYGQNFYQIKEYLNSSEGYTYHTSHEMEDGIDGSPYIKDSMQIGMIRFDGHWFKDILLRYDAYNEQMQALVSKEGLTALDPASLPVDSMIVYDELFVPKKVANTSKTVMLVPLYDNKGIALYKRYRASFKPFEEPEGYKAAQNASYKLDPPNFYIESGTNIELVNKYSDLADFFMMDAKEIKKMAKKNKLNLKKQDDLIKLVDMLALR